MIKFDKYAIFDINRKYGVKPETTQNIDEKLIKKLSIDALPFGEPPENATKVITIDDTLYYSHLIIDKKADKGKAIILALDKDHLSINPLSLVESSNELLKQLISDNKKKKEIELESRPMELKFFDIKDFDKIIFALITKQKTIIMIEKEQDVLSVLYTLFECIPPELRVHLSFTAPASSFEENTVVSCIIMNEANLKLLDENRAQYNILFPLNNMAYGKYTSPICKNLAKLFAQGEKDQIKEIISKYYEMAVADEELVNPGDYSEENDLEIGDAVLVQWMRANHYNKKMNEGFLDKLGKI